MFSLSVCFLSEGKLQEKNALAGIIRHSAEQGQNAVMAVIGESKPGEGLEENGHGLRKRDVPADIPPEGNSKRLKLEEQQPSMPQSMPEEPGGMGKVARASYCVGEAKIFDEEIHAIGSSDEKRLKNAADDVICALNYVFETEFSNYDRDSSQTAILRAKSMCFSLWCEFLFKGEVVLNGKRIKAYSALRPELQHLARLAKEKITLQGSSHDPLAIARELTQELIDAPVTMIVEGDDDCHARVTTFIRERQAEVAKLQSFLQNTFNLPLSTHECVIASLKFAIAKSSLSLVDFVSNIQGNIEFNLPARWLSFAMDVSDYYAGTGGFASGCEQAWGCESVTLVDVSISGNYPQRYQLIYINQYIYMCNT